MMKKKKKRKKKREKRKKTKKSKLLPNLKKHFKIPKKKKKKKIEPKVIHKQKALLKVGFVFFILIISDIFILWKKNFIVTKHAVIAASLISIFFSVVLSFCMGKIKKSERTIERIRLELIKNILQKKGRYKTQLDMIYYILKKTKTLKLSEIAEGFKVEKTMAEKWMNILVEHGLAEVKYPSFGEPILKWKMKK